MLACHAGDKRSELGGVDSYWRSGSVVSVHQSDAIGLIAESLENAIRACIAGRCFDEGRVVGSHLPDNQIADSEGRLRVFRIVTVFLARLQSAGSLDGLLTGVLYCDGLLDFGEAEVEVTR